MMSFRAYRAACSVCLFFVLTAGCAGPARAEEGPQERAARYEQELIARAAAAGLAREHYWDLLLHYEPAGTGRESLVDDPRFFLAPQGKTDPSAELAATIHSFFLPPREQEEPPRCRFMGRYRWLRQQLTIDESLLPAVRCVQWEELLARMRPKKAALVFPATYANGPASMFGHTLIRIDGEYRNDLLSYAVNYAALTGDTTDLFYPIKGIFGVYPGYYSILPYYEKVQEYSSLEHRDMWEYELDLTEEEVLRLVAHIWDLRNVYSDYYFFTENCSYELLYLIEAARPSAPLIEHFRDQARFWVIPVDTIRVVRDLGMVSAVRYRPSQAAKIRYLSAGLSADRQRMARDISRGGSDVRTAAQADITRGEQRRVLELAAEDVQYRALKKEISKEVYLKEFLSILQARSELGDPGAERSDVPVPERPDLGHAAGKFAVGGGCRTGTCFGELSWRAVYHDLADDPAGYVEGSQVLFSQIIGRYYDDDKRLRLESFRAIDIVSLSPWSRFFTPVSWKIATGVEQRTLAGGRDRQALFLNGGAGLTGGNDALLVYALVDGELDGGTAYDHGFSVSAGGSGGVLANWSGKGKWSLSVRSLLPVAGDPVRSTKAAAVQNVFLGENRSIKLSASREKTAGRYRSEAAVTGNWYY